MMMEGGDLISKEKALPAVLQWLAATYESARGSAIPKRDVYADYVNFCVSHSIEPTNAPAFGKILRMVFPDITSRRLGRRGHTSHHYNHFRRKVDPNHPPAQSGPPSHQFNRPMSYPSEDPLRLNNSFQPYPIPTRDQQPLPPRHFAPFNGHNNNPLAPPSNYGPYVAQPPAPSPLFDRHTMYRGPAPQQGGGGGGDYPLHGNRPHPAPSSMAPPRYPHEGPPAFSPARNISPYPMVGDESLRESLPNGRMNLSPTLQMGQSSFGDEEFMPPGQYKQGGYSPYPPPARFTSLPSYPQQHPLPPSYPPPMNPQLSQSLPGPSPIYHSTQFDYQPPPPVQPTQPLPPRPPQPPTDSSSLKALIGSPSFTLQGAESFNYSISDFDPRIRGSTVPVVICSTAHHTGRRLSKASFGSCSDIFPLDTGKVPIFAIDTQQLPYNDLKQEARHFTTMYRNHMQTVFIALTPPFDFEAVCSAVYMFWPQAKRFHRLFSSQCVIDQILEIDSMLYSAMLSLIIPDLFEETPQEVIERIIHFSREFPEWLRAVTAFVLPLTMYEFKLKVAENFAKALYTRAIINQLSIKLRRGLDEQKRRESDEPEKSTMLEDWGALDFEYIDGQTKMFGEFKKIPATIKDQLPVLLAQRVQVEAWSKWLLEVTENVMKGHYAPYTLTVSEFLLKWTMYTSLISKYLIEIHSCNLELYLLLFCWIEAVLALYLDEHEQLQLKKAKAPKPQSFSLRRNSLPGTASFSSLTPTPIGQTLIPNIMMSDDDFSGF